MSYSWGKKSMQNVIKWQVGCASSLDWLTKNKKSLRWGKLPDVFLFISPAIGGGKRVLAAAARGWEVEGVRGREKLTIQSDNERCLLCCCCASATVSHISLSVLVSLCLLASLSVRLSICLLVRCLSLCLCSVSCTSFFYVSFEQEILSTEIMRKRQLQQQQQQQDQQ